MSPGRLVYKLIGTEVFNTALSLLDDGEITGDQLERILKARSFDQLAEIAEDLLGAKEISVDGCRRLLAAADQDEGGKAKAKMRAKMREIDRYVGDSKGHRYAQGGLPSLGRWRRGVFGLCVQRS